MEKLEKLEKYYKFQILKIINEYISCLNQQCFILYVSLETKNNEEERLTIGVNFERGCLFLPINHPRKLSKAFISVLEKPFPKDCIIKNYVEGENE